MRKRIRRRKRRVNPIQSKAEWRLLAAKMTRGQLSKPKFDEMVRKTKTPYSRLPERLSERELTRRRRKRSHTRKRNPSGRLTTDQRTILKWMLRNGGLSDGKRTSQNAKVRRVLASLHSRGMIRKTGRVGKNARYTMTTKGYDAIKGRVKGVRTY